MFYTQDIMVKVNVTALKTSQCDGLGAGAWGTDMYTIKAYYKTIVF